MGKMVHVRRPLGKAGTFIITGASSSIMEGWGWDRVYRSEKESHCKNPEIYVKIKAYKPLGIPPSKKMVKNRVVPDFRLSRADLRFVLHLEYAGLS